MSQADPNAIINRSVTNRYEATEFSLLFGLHVIQLMVILKNLNKLLLYHIRSQQSPNTLYCVNSNLLILSILKCITMSYPVLAYSLSSESEDYYHTLTYQFLSNFGILMLNMTLMIVANIWFSALKIKYQSSKKERVLSLALKIITLINVLINSIALIVCFLSAFINDTTINKLNWLFIILSTTLADAVFTVSCFYFYNSVKDMIRIQNNRKYILRALNVLLMLGSLNRIAFFIIRSTHPQVLVDLKNQEEKSLTDQGPTWALLTFEYFMISDFVPTMILTFIFSPQIRTDSVTIVGSQIEFRKSIGKTVPHDY